MIVAARHKIDIPLHRILIIQLGDIGDVVWGIPAYCSVKLAYPQAELFLLTRDPFGDLLLDDPHITRVFQVKKNFRASLSLLRQLRKLRLDLVVDLRADDRGAYTSFFSGAKMRAALFYPGLSRRNHFFTHLVDPEPVKERVFGAAEQSLKIIRGLGIKEETSVPRIVISAESEQKVRQVIAAENILANKGWISINPFSRWSYKEWGIEKWRQLVSSIWEKYGLPSLIVGSQEERERAANLFQNTLSPVYNLAGKTSLREIGALLKMSRLHIGVDSAAPHIAAAVGTPTVTIYGPSDWRDWAPPGKKNKVVLPDMNCSPCHQKGCDGSGLSRCLETIDADKVMAAVEELLR
ncbi:MAG: glycosyltransferase family 9 protein [Syntrophaceae bacterium]|nr:glycosyltransferase family 9 protein [Syntrophaceae bacterium]